MENNEGNTGVEKREAQKRLSWIANVKRIEGLTQEQAEKKWTEIFNNNDHLKSAIENAKLLTDGK